MRRLILFRHAKAEAGAPGADDFDRALTARGRRDALAMGRRLAEVGFAPDLALVSSAVRARETWSSAAEAFAGSRVEFHDTLYNAAARTILDEVRAWETGTATLMVIGHNPGLQELAVTLVLEGAGSAVDIRRLGSEFSTATAAIFGVDEAGRFALAELFTPDPKARSAAR